MIPLNIAPVSTLPKWVVLPKSERVLHRKYRRRVACPVAEPVFRGGLV